MTTYVALLDGGKREERVEVGMLGPGLYQVRVGGKVHAVDAFRHDHGTLSLVVDVESYSVQLDQRATGVKIHLRDSVYSLEVLDERRLRMRRSAARFTVEGRQALVAPLPCKVVRVLRRPGDAVRDGEGVVAVEFMGMENEIRSPRDGKVAELLVQEGQAVVRGAAVASVE